jgi:hypothetical protein
MICRNEDKFHSFSLGHVDEHDIFILMQINLHLVTGDSLMRFEYEVISFWRNKTGFHVKLNR